MDGASRRPSIKERLGLKGLACCNPTLGLGRTTTEDAPPPLCPDQIEVVENPPSMTLAEAMAAERQWRASQESNTSVSPGGVTRVSLKRLLQETDDEDIVVKEEEEESELGSAFIPCGHTFCRVCSRDLWLNRSFCPICNRFILHILDLY